ncbi:MAG: EVE domain-containing protein [Pseudomonadota bacterium]|nr:EVE domain-containing protein [Pseudomonadota bacterium]
MAYWLMKSEPEVFGIDHLAQQQQSLWDGVRNYQARNFMRQMQVGDTALFYHSNCKIPAIVGVMRISRAGYPDPTQFDPDSPYYDPKSTVDQPRWTAVDVAFVEKWAQPLSLQALKAMPELADLALVKKGNRLSLMPLTETEWHAVMQTANAQSATL